MVRLRFAAPVFVSFFVLLAACVGDDPTPASGSSSSSGGTPDASSSGGEGGPGTCAGDAIEACGDACTPCAAPTDGHAECKNRQCQMVCDSGKTLCGDACVVTATSSDHCGKCGHSCGGGQCTTGVCQPIVVASGLTNTHAIDVSPTDGVIISADQNVVRCDVPTGCSSTALKAVATGYSGLTDAVVAGAEVYLRYQFGDNARIVKCPMPAGCPAAASIGNTDIAYNFINYPISRVVTAGSKLVWAMGGANGPSVGICGLPGCTTPTVIRAQQSSATLTNSDTTNPIAALAGGATGVLYGSGVYGVGGVNVRSCAFAGCGTSPTDINGGGAVRALTFFNGKFYVAMAGGASDAIWSVDEGTTTLKSVGADLAGITDIVADASGIYWTNGTTGKINRCDLAGCAGGTELASGQTGASRVRVDSTYVYWLTPTSVLKIVKN